MLRVQAISTLRHRALSAMAFACAFVCLSATTALAQAPTSPDLVEEIRLPIDQITPDLLTNRVPVPLAEYQSLRRIAETHHNTPSPTRLIKAQYTATYTGHRLEGQLSWSIENTSGIARACPIEPLVLSLRDLKWGDQPAVWGTSPSGRFEVLLDRPQGDIHARWELHGKTVGLHDEFVMQLPRATASQLILNVPVGHSVSAPGQIVTAGATQNGVTIWTIVLAGHAECRVIIHQPQSTESPNPLILVQNESLYAMRQEGLRFRTDLRLEVTQAPVSEVPIWVDPDLEIYSITYANDIPLPWTTTSVDGRQRLLVRLPDSLLGAGRVLRLRGVAPIKSNVEWKLPNVAVAGAALVEGTAVLQLTPPLQLLGLATSGFRQIGVETSPNRDDLLTFKQFRSDGVLTVKLGKPQPRIVAQVLSDLQARSNEWTCRTQLQLTGTEGAAFTVDCRIPAGWDVLDVREVAAPELDWTVITNAEGQRLLRLQFLEALSADKTRTIEIDARREATHGEQTHIVPAFEPLHVADLGLLVAVSSSADVKPVSESGTSFEPCEPSDLDPEWLNSKFWKTRLTERTPPPLLLRLNGNAAEGRFSLQSKQTPIEVVADMRIDVRADKLTKHIRLAVTPRHGKIERVLIYQSESGPQLTWNLVGTSPRPVEARRIPAFRHAAWDLPASGELWELRLPEAQSGPFELDGIRVRGFSPSGRLGLLVVPQAQSFQGRVTVNTAPGLGLELTAYNADADGVPHVGPAPVDRTWTWHEPAALQFQSRVTSDRIPAPVIRAANIQANWGAEPSGFDHYSVGLELGAGFNGRPLSCELPVDAELIAVQVDGQEINMTPPQAGTPLILTSVADEQRVTIAYRVRSPGLHVPRWRAISLPKLDIPVLRCDVELRTPTGFLLGDESRGLVLSTSVPGNSFLKRVFGPLGRSAGDMIFNPFSLESWSGVWGEPAAIQGSRFGESTSHTDKTRGWGSAGSHVGWQVWRGSAAMLPDRIEVCLWSDHQAIGLAWLGFSTCLLLGTLLRRRGVTGRAGVGLVASIIEIILTLTLPPVAAQVAGGCLAGTLLSFLWPRRLIRIPEVAPDPSPLVPQGSTRSYQPSSPPLPLGLLIAVGAVLTASLVSAQPKTTGNRALPRVVIPVDAQGQPMGQTPLAYVPEQPLKDWTVLQASQQPHPDWLLKSAEYVLRRDANSRVTFTARYELVVMRIGDEVEIDLPLTGVNFGGEQACLVDGQPHPLLTRPDSKTIAIRVAGVSTPKPADNGTQTETDKSQSFPFSSRSYQVELRGYPVIQSVADRKWMEFNLPRLHGVSWTLQNDLAESPWTLHTGDRFQTVAPGQSVTRELGPLTRLRIEPATATEAVKPVIDARLALLADVRPAVCELHYQVGYRVLQGQVSRVALEIPPGIAVREVAGAEVFDWHLTSSTGGTSLLQIDLRSPVSEGFRITIKAWLPNDGPPTQVSIPPVLLFTSEQQPLRPVNNVVGIRTPAEFVPEAPSDAGEQVASATLDSFTTEWGMSNLVPPPQAAFNLLDPTPLKVGLRPLTAQRVVRMTAVGVLGSRRLNWNLNATIEIQNAAAYSHQIEIDPRLTVTNVSIQEDAANRLLRWTRTGNNVQVFLRDKSTGTQTLSLHGTMPTQVPQEFALPVVQIRDATVADAKLQIYQEPDLEVDVVDADKWPRLEVPSEVRLGVARNLLVGRFQWDQVGGPFVVNARQNEPVLDYSAVTSLQPRDGRWKLKCNLLFEVRKGHGSQFSIRVPPELPLVGVDAADVRQLFERDADGGQRIVLIPQAPVRGRFVVQVSGDVNLPPGSSGVVPEIMGLNATRKKHYVVLPADGSLTVEPRSSGLTAATLPLDLSKLLPTDLQGTKQAEYSGAQGTWTVSVPRPQEDTPQTGVLWSETQVWCGPVNRLSGRTTILLGPVESENIDVIIPGGLQLRGVLVDGEFRTQAVADQQLRVPLTSPQSGHVVSLFWTQETASFSGLMNRAELSWPHVKGQSIAEQYATVTPPAGFRVHARAAATANRLSVQLSEVEVLLQLMELRSAGGPAPQDPQWMFLQRQTAALIKRLTSEPTLMRASGELSESFAKLRAQFLPWEQLGPGHDFQSGPDQQTSSALHSFDELEESLSGPHSLLVRISPNGQAPRLEITVIRESLWNWVTGLGLALLVIVTTWPLSRWKFPDWLAAQPAFAWLILGLLWWTCLTPSWLGLIWLSLSAIHGIQSIWRTHLMPSQLQEAL